MSLELVILRLLHILVGAFWAGALIFNAVFLGPSLAEAGPDGAKVMAGLQRRGLMLVLPLAGLVTILSGIWLYWRISNGFDPAFGRTRLGMAYGAGGLLAIVGFGIGLSVMRPAMMRIGALAPQAAQATAPAEREALMAQVAALRTRAAGAAKIVAVLLALATALMGVARYL